MTIALKIGSQDSQVQGFIYLDAVTRYGRDLSGKVTTFPVDSGANISDHFIANNPKFTLEGVVSDVDVTGVSDKVRLDDQKPVNARQRPLTPYISAQNNSLQYLPSAVKQFFERTTPVVSAEASSQTAIPAVQMLFEELMGGTYYNSADNRWRNKMTPTTLYEMDGVNFSTAHTDLVVTSVAFDEDADTGDALHLSITLEKVRLVNIDQTDVPRMAAPAIQKKVAETEKKGNPSAESGTGDTDTTNSRGPIAGTLNEAIKSSREARGGL